MMVPRSWSNWRIAAETAVIIVGLMVVKIVAQQLDLDFIALTSLTTSVIGGCIFIFGLMLAGTLTDYKESERIPSEVVSACESLLEEGAQVEVQYPQFDERALVARLKAVVTTFEEDLRSVESKTCLVAISALSASLAEMERLGVPANHVVRLEGEQSAIRKLVLRTYYIQRTTFLPAARSFLHTVVGLIVLLLLFTKMGSPHESVVLTGVIAFLFIHMLKLLARLDSPFGTGLETQDGVSRVQFAEFIARADAEVAARTTDGATGAS